MKEVSLNFPHTKIKLTNTFKIFRLQGIKMDERAENKKHVDNLIEILVKTYCKEENIQFEHIDAGIIWGEFRL